MSNSTNEEIINLSQMTAKSGKEDQLRQALQALIQPTLQEDGCLAYELWQNHTDKRSFIMYERFQNQEIFEKHVNSTYVQKFTENEYTTCVESHWDLDLRAL